MALGYSSEQGAIRAISCRRLERCGCAIIVSRGASDSSGVVADITEAREFEILAVMAPRIVPRHITDSERMHVHDIRGRLRFRFVCRSRGNRFPGKGWTLIKTGLTSPVTRNRNMAIKALEGWNPSDFRTMAMETVRSAWEKSLMLM